MEVVPPGWRRLVRPPDCPAGTADKAAYVFCVLEQFHPHLHRRDVFATPSAAGPTPPAKLLVGPAWDAAKPSALNALQLPEEPGLLLETTPVSWTRRGATSPRAWAAAPRCASVPTGGCTRRGSTP